MDSMQIFGNSGRWILRGSTLGDKIRAEIDNRIGEIAKVNALIENFGKRHRLPDTIIAHLELACDELLTNVISYGFLDGKSHKIIIKIALEADTLVAEIIDDGIAFNPLTRPMPDIDLTTEEREIGGLGIHFVRRVMDHVDYRRSEEQNHLRMIKKVPATPAKGSKPWHTAS